MADVTFTRPEYNAALPSWRLINDVCAGERAVKARTITYLPQPNPDDESQENDTRYRQYLARAVFYNATGRTAQGLVGSAFRKWPSLEVPTAIDYVSTDIDGAGVSIYQQSQSVLGAVLRLGRHGLLVDYPQVDSPASRADMASGRVRSTVVSVQADQIINWRMEKIGAAHQLVLLVISETKETVTADGFGMETEAQFRVLRLVEGVYTQEIWRAGDGGIAIMEGPFVVRDGSGRPWDVIPFTFVGSENNDASIDEPPLYDLSVLNIAHYRNSADYEDSAFFVGQAQPWMAGLTEEWRNWLEQTGIYVGSRSPILLPEGGTFGIAQAQPNTLVKEAMDQKERQMVAIGARLIQPGGAVKTATEARGEQEAEHSVLSIVASNVSEAYTQALNWMARFMGVPESCEYAISQDFVEQRLDPNMLTALISAWQSGQMPESDLWAQLRKYGVIDPEKGDEEIREELSTQDPGLNLDAST